MDYCNARVGACPNVRDAAVRDLPAMASYPTFAAPTPINLSRGYVGNTLTPGMIPSPLNFSSITPPSSPYSLYGLYSPAGRTSTMFDPAYLRKLKSNPMFRDLQSLLLQECLQMQVPASLITTSWNLMELHNNPKNQSNPSIEQVPATSSTHQQHQPIRSSGQQVYFQHMKLQDKLLKVRIDPAISADGLLVETDYGKEVGRVEMERYQALHSCSDAEVKERINSYYDKERLNLARQTEGKLDVLIVKAEQMRATASQTVIPSSSIQMNTTNTRRQNEEISLQAKSNLPQQGASLLLQPDEKNTAVRKLKFNLTEVAEHNQQQTAIDGNNDVSTSSAAAAEKEDEEDDYLNGSVNSEDFEIDEIDVETVDKDENTCDTAGQACGYQTMGANDRGTPSDLLQQCLSESGITEEPLIKNISESDISFSLEKLISYSSPSAEPDHNNDTTNNTTNNTTRETLFPDSSTLDSPMSLDSVESTSQDSHNTSDNSQASNPATHTSQELERDSKPVSLPITIKDEQSSSAFQIPVPQMAPYFDFLSHSNITASSPIVPHTPISLMQRYQATNNNINMALSQMSKICSGSTVTFTPELRRDTIPTEWTPSENSQFSPLVYNQHKSNSTGLNNRSELAATSRKRKSTFDEEEDSRFSSADLQNNNIFSSNNKLQSSNNQNENKSATELPKGSDDLNGVPKNVTFRTRGSLTAEATNILSQWYHSHVSYPYPNDVEVEQLARVSGITERQVKKWMANKRVRCFNTLSITGNQHPIKHKYKGQGRKKNSVNGENDSTTESSETEKENCGSTSEEKRGTGNNYSTLTEEAKQRLNQWYEEHVINPYPSEEEKQQLADECSISVSQVKSWFANKRNRTNNTRRQVPNYFINKFPEYCPLVQMVGQKREEERMLKRRKLNEYMYIQPSFYF